MGYWAKPGLDRRETRLFTPTLDECVGENHPVRHLDEILRGMDWSDWTAQYNGRVGQPPIPPWVMAGVILYGLMRRIRSSRQLEYACTNHIDFIWLAEGRTIDHDTMDAAFGTGANLEGMQREGVDFYTPVESPSPEEGNPARRNDPRQPVPEPDWPNLPRNDKKKLAKSCFVYDEAADVYYCPMGHAMPYRETKSEERSSGTVSMRVYRCDACEGCPLAGACLDPKAKRGRTVRRDAQERLREKMHAKLRTDEGRKTYNQRMHVAETPFAIIKGILEVRRFLLRGLEKVRTEWTWVCTAYNLKKLIAVLAAQRAENGKMPAWSGS